ncbi:folylpolyglutamate synthase/dihydrofolate synthase family protein [uncultured Clostridium sp.]|uniref:bifunctional folylpolyglutamate synthase/dihydrofolate synthase n=1 Tax=uncultured Clostridium sp. TaxID=59620 RepID=UPI0025D8078B|nr:folylpolyglutamate synthase/dihydrofolate synthase family protein [uncultured Clostridium sp.]
MKMTYEEAMKYISSIGMFGSNYGLDRTYRLLELLGNPQNKLKLVHIAGTNGKGSTTAMVSRILSGMGYKVGMYTSPYLEEFEERIQINGINIPKDKLVENLEKVKCAVSRVIEEGYEHPTEFEIITVLMFLYFCSENVDYAVIEVGLGGRLDSTNVIVPKVSVIASISLDHTNLLGSTLSEIAGEKAGIIKEGVPVVLYPQKKEAEDIILRTAENKKSRVYSVSSHDGKLISIDYDNNTQNVEAQGINGTYNIDLPLLGSHQILNLCVAVKAVEVLCREEGIECNKKILEESLKDVKWIGRLETLNKKPLIVIDGAHNIDGIKALTNNIKRYFKYDKMYLLLGILADKQVGEMIEEIAPMAEKIYALTPHNDRAELSEDLKKEIKKINENVEAFEDYEIAIREALKEAGDDDIILVSGSLYMVGDMRKIITKVIK